MTDSTNTQMHRDHTAWTSEINMWRDDLRAWQRELAQAQAELVNLEKPLQDHAHTLRVHGSALRLYQQDFDGHEHALCEHEHEGSSKSAPVCHGHNREAEHQAEQRRAHQRLKQHHHTVMLHWNRLLHILRQPFQD